MQFQVNTSLTFCDPTFDKYGLGHIPAPLGGRGFRPLCPYTLNTTFGQPLAGCRMESTSPQAGPLPHLRELTTVPCEPLLVHTLTSLWIRAFMAKGIKWDII